MYGKKKVQNWIIRILEDPLVKILLENSHLTKIQAETLLIDILTEEAVGEKIGFEEKAKLRLTKAGVSRGAFNRTLNQARSNIIRSIYSILLLGYLGVLENPTLKPFIEISNRLESYMETYSQVWNELKTGTVDEEKLKIISIVREEIESTLEVLSRPRSLGRQSGIIE
ncbi:MAG: hypothetical protein ACE5Z5_00390 [Candidatus Bathyarchaeia archaeon]